MRANQFGGRRVVGGASSSDGIGRPPTRTPKPKKVSPKKGAGAAGLLAIGGTVEVKKKPKVEQSDKVETKRLALLNADAKLKDKDYWKTEGPKVMEAYRKNRAEFDKKLAYENSTEGYKARVREQDKAARKQKYGGTIDSSPTY
jgi:hypothetical protein